MNKDHYLRIAEVYRYNSILVIFICVISACKENPNAPHNLAEEEIIEENLPPRAQQEAEPDTTFTDSSFVIFNGTSFDDQSEELTEAGLTPIDIVYKSHLWGTPGDQISEWGLPPQQRVAEQARQAKAINSEIMILDIEHWPTKGPDATVKRSIDNYITVYDWFKEEAPGMTIGYYDMVPRKNWFASTSQRLFDRWQAHNDFMSPFAQKVDAFFPNLYTYKKDNREYWVKSTEVYLKEVRRIGGDKPVYAFLWPQYWHTQNESLKDVYIDAEFWRLQLETARKYTDGVVIWFPYDTDWEEASQGPWLEVTKEFLGK